MTARDEVNAEKAVAAMRDLAKEMARLEQSVSDLTEELAEARSELRGLVEAIKLGAGKLGAGGMLGGILGNVLRGR